MFKTIGKFDLEVWEGGHPVHITIEDERGNRIMFSHKDLSDLGNAVKEAKKAAFSSLDEVYRHEV